MSCATTAKPSTLERSNDGTSTGDTTSVASTRPSASASVHVLDAERHEIEHRLEAALRLVAIQDGEELLLPRPEAVGEGAHPYSQTSTSAPAGKPSLSSSTITKPSALVVEDSREAPEIDSGSTRPCCSRTRA